MENKQSIFLSGLWIKKDEGGSTYLSGMIGGKVKILVLRNSNKRKGSQDADYNIYLAPHVTKDIWKTMGGTDKVSTGAS